MSAYEKPMIHVVPEQAEGIFMASGDKTVCRFGRTEANPGADTCQACSKSGGTASKLAESIFRSDYNGLRNLYLVQFLNCWKTIPFRFSRRATVCIRFLCPAGILPSLKKRTVTG